MQNLNLLLRNTNIHVADAILTIVDNYVCLNSDSYDSDIGQVFIDPTDEQLKRIYAEIRKDIENGFIDTNLYFNQKDGLKWGNKTITIDELYL
jgi:hypothetical protein